MLAAVLSASKADVVVADGQARCAPPEVSLLATSSNVVSLTRATDDRSLEKDGKLRRKEQARRGDGRVFYVEDDIDIGSQ